MSATTLDVIIDRVRSLCVEAPFEYIESVRFDSFDLQPAGAFDGAFRVEGVSHQERGWYNYMTERTDLLTVTVQKAINDDHDDVRRYLTRTAHSLTSAIVQDGAVASGLYAVADRGQVRKINIEDTDQYAVLRVTLPINYEAQL